MISSSISSLELEDYLTEVRPRLPKAEDHDGAANGILRLQETYNFDASSFINVTSTSIGSTSLMHLQDFFHIGRIAYLNNKMTLTSQWMQLALNNIGVTDEEYLLGYRNHKINYEIDIRDHLVFAEYRVGLSSLLSAIATNYIMNIALKRSDTMAQPLRASCSCRQGPRSIFSIGRANK